MNPCYVQKQLLTLLAQLLVVVLSALYSLGVRDGFLLFWLAQDEASSLRWSEAFIFTYLERYIPALGSRTPVTTLRRLWIMLAHVRRVHNQFIGGNEMGLKNLLKINKQQTHNPSRETVLHLLQASVHNIEDAREALANAFSLPAAQKRGLG